MIAMIGTMESTGWRERLAAAIEKDGRSPRAVSLAIGRSGGYVRSILVSGKEPSLDAFVALCDELNADPMEILFNLKTNDAVALRLFRAYSQMTAAQREKFLDLAQVIAGQPDGKNE